tara:strand:+ start:614 stop:868 length:255 start_codon:yes stop_codon:yes gene_type:complete
MMIPQRTKDSLDRYVNDKILPGGFLIKVLSNDLFGAVAQADKENLAALPAIVFYIYNQLPGDSWGSRDQVYRFVEDKFYERVGS